MTDTITLKGIVGTTPQEVQTSSVPICSFRLASSQRYYDRAKQTWVDRDSNWYTVSCYRHLARNVVQSLRSGDHVVVTGRLRIRDWTSGERRGTAVEIDADAVGHDLAWGTSQYTRAVRAPQPAEQRADRPASERELVGAGPGGSGSSAAYGDEPSYRAPGVEPSSAGGFLPEEDDPDDAGGWAAREIDD